MTCETLLQQIERRVAIPVTICPNCRLPILVGQMTDNIESQHLVCPSKDEERRDYCFAEDAQ